MENFQTLRRRLVRSVAMAVACTAVFCASAGADMIKVTGKARTINEPGLEPDLLARIGFNAPVDTDITFEFVYDTSQYEGIGWLTLHSDATGDEIVLPAPFRILGGAQDDVTTSLGDVVDWFGAGSYANYDNGVYGPLSLTPPDPAKGDTYVRFQVGLRLADYDASILPGATPLTYLNDLSPWETRHFEIAVEDVSRASNWYFNALSARVTEISAVDVTPPPPPDPDADHDGVPDTVDKCPGTAPGVATNGDGCSINQLVPCSVDGKTWANHGDYMAALAHAADAFLAAGLINQAEHDAIISTGARNKCGKTTSK